MQTDYSNKGCSNPVEQYVEQFREPYRAVERYAVRYGLDSIKTAIINNKRLALEYAPEDWFREYKRVFNASPNANRMIEDTPEIIKAVKTRKKLLGPFIEHGVKY